MTISFSYYEILVFIHRHLVEIISLLTLGVIVLAIILIVNACHKRKAIISARKFHGYKIFSPQEWDTFLNRASKNAAERIVGAYNLSPKSDDFKIRLCGTWCNPDDTRRYYISNRGGFFVMVIEERATTQKHQSTYILRNSIFPTDKNLFYADGDICITFGYEPEDDIIFNPTFNEELERREKHIRHNMGDVNPTTDVKMSLTPDLVDAALEASIEENSIGLE